jgi:hypothetical protein
MEHIQQILGNNDVIPDEILCWNWKYSRHLYFPFYCSNRLLQKNNWDPLSFKAEMFNSTEIFFHLSYYLHNWLLRNNSSVRHGAVQVRSICKTLARSSWKVNNNNAGAHFSNLLEINSTNLRMAAVCFFLCYSIILTHFHNLKFNQSGCLVTLL